MADVVIEDGGTPRDGPRWAGYGAAGSIEQTGERDYHYGLTPHGLLFFASCLAREL